MRDMDASPIWMTRASAATVSARPSHNISSGSHCMPVSSSGCMCRSTRRTSELVTSFSWRQIMRCGSFSGRGTESVGSRRRFAAAVMGDLEVFGDP